MLRSAVAALLLAFREGLSGRRLDGMRREQRSRKVSSGEMRVLWRRRIMMLSRLKLGR